jgi:hypothetical protein
MVDSLKTFNEGEHIYASETNSNNQYLLSKLSDNAAQLQTYVEGEISSIQSNVASVQATLQANIDSANANITNSLKGRTFTQSAKTIGIGTTSLSSYLPNDGYAYWVLVQAGAEGTGDKVLTAKTDLMTTARYLYKTDHDAGRNSRAWFLGVLPVGTGRSITTAGTTDGVTLCGYCKM